MKKVKILFLTAFAAVLCCAATVCAYGDTIRVGLEKNFKNVSSITIDDNTIKMGIGSGSRYNIGGKYTINVISNEYYAIGEYYDTYAEAKKNLPRYTGYNCVAALTDSGWTIYVRTDGKKLNKEIIHTGESCVGFMYEGKYKFIVDGSEPVRVSGSDGDIGVGNSFYRGEIEILRQGSVMTAVNVIDEDEYLYGVINSEMPSTWDEEAQKAQAVAARTYLRKCKGKHDVYDVCDGVHCQAYNGTKYETEAGIKAVDETKDLCIYYNDSLIDAVYFSSDGGATIDSVDAWGNEAPYLKGKKDKYEKEYKEWTREFTYSELTSMCSAMGYDIGNVIKVEAEYNQNGIVTQLTFKGSKNQASLTMDKIRTAFSVTSGGSLYSRNFVVASGAVNSDESTVAGAVINAASVGTEDMISNMSAGTAGLVTFYGKGNGHSTGMSQYGAKGMAEEGYDFEEILKFYYTDVEIK